MRVILSGSRAFGLATYDALREDGHEILAVMSPPRPGPDSAGLTYGAQRDGTPWLHPVERTPENVAKFGADLIVCAHSHDFISRPVRRETRLGGIGYHPSLLPRHRGRDAVRWTVSMGDPIAGGSVYWLTDNVDGGPIAAQDWCFVPRGTENPDERVSRLWRDELFPMGVRLLRKVLRDLEDGTIVEMPQDERHATWEPSWERPPLHRPDLTQIGTGIPGYRHVTTRER